MFALSSALLPRIFRPCWTSNLCLPHSMFSVTLRRIATGLDCPLFVLIFRRTLMWSVPNFRPFTLWIFMSFNFSAIWSRFIFLWHSLGRTKST
jgi:hypothetical protein